MQHSPNPGNFTVGFEYYSGFVDVGKPIASALFSLWTYLLFDKNHLPSTCYFIQEGSFLFWRSLPGMFGYNSIDCDNFSYCKALLILAKNGAL